MSIFEDMAQTAVNKYLAHYPNYLETIGKEDSLSERVHYYRVCLETCRKHELPIAYAQMFLEEKLEKLIEDEMIKERNRHNNAPWN